MTIITALELTSQVRYIADGESVEFPITFERLDNSHVKAWLYDPDKDEVTELARSIAGNIATITPPPNQNDYVVVHRETPKVPMVDWATTGGESRNSRVLSEKQLRYIALEARDWSQYPIRSIVATSPPPFTWRQVAPGETLNKGDNNHGVDFIAPGTLRIPPAVGQEREFSVIIRLPVGTTTIIAQEATIDGQESIDVTATGEDRLLGILLRKPGVFNTAGRHQATVRVEDVDGIGAVGVDLLLCQDQREGWEALGLSNAVEYTVSTLGNATATQLVLGGDTRLTVATSSKNGIMSAADKAKLDTMGAGYTHPTGDGNQHVPATGTTNNNKALMAGSTAGSASWKTIDYSWLTNKPTSLPASDVYAWAKAASKPSYTAAEVGASADNHKHDASDINSGVFVDSRLPSRLWAQGPIVSDANDAQGNGNYWLQPQGGNNPNPGYYGHIATFQHSDTYATQNCWSFAADGSADTMMWRRGLNGGTWSTWYRLRISEAEQALLWAPLSHNHSASNLTSGTVPDARLPGRFIGGWNNSVVADANLAVMRGSYYIDATNAGALNAPFTAASANIDVVNLDSNGSSWAAQFATAIGGSGLKNKVRYKTSGTWGSWLDAPVSVSEQGLYWSPVTHTEHTGVLNYSTALRGLVTQGTSHTTPVTLNAAQGSIKMAAGTIAAGASVDFQFNNSYITDTAMPIVTRRGTSHTTVTASVLRFAPGYCIIRVTNTGASSVSNVEPAMSFHILGVETS